MKPDICNKEDIKTIVQLFYEKVKTDDVIGFFFSEVVSINWQKHLPAMCAFWENVLFYTGEYEGNPLESHRKIHVQQHTSPKHFERWIQLWDETLDEHFKGTNADKMKTYAKAIAAIMINKI